MPASAASQGDAVAEGAGPGFFSKRFSHRSSRSKGSPAHSYHDGEVKDPECARSDIGDDDADYFAEPAEGPEGSLPGYMGSQPHDPQCHLAWAKNKERGLLMCSKTLPDPNIAGHKAEETRSAEETRDGAGRPTALRPPLPGSATPEATPEAVDVEDVSPRAQGHEADQQQPSDSQPPAPEGREALGGRRARVAWEPDLSQRSTFDPDNSRHSRLDTNQVAAHLRMQPPPSLLRATSKYTTDDTPDRRSRGPTVKVLTFADEHGQDLQDVRYTPRLYYSRQGVRAPGEFAQSGSCCIIA